MQRLLFLMLMIFFASIGTVYAEEISSFDADLTIKGDATVRVIETINYQFGSVQRHGIYRDIPVSYVNSVGDERTISIDDISVIDPQTNMPYVFDVLREGKNIRIKIGDARTYVTGMITYEIAYTVSGAINYFDDHDEFYWNVTGDQWQVPIASTHVRVQSPQIMKTTCFAGIYGSTASCDELRNNNEMETVFDQGFLAPGSAVTIVVGMPVGVIKKPTMWERITAYLFDNGVLFVPVVVFFGMMRLWYIKGRDPKGKGTVVPFYEAPRDLSAAEVGMMTHGMVMSKTISAAIIQLAVHGYVTIRKIDKEGILGKEDYVFMRTEKDPSTLSVQDRLLYDGIFGSAQQKKMSDLTNTFYKDLIEIKKSVEEAIMHKKYYVRNPNTVRTLYITISVGMIVGSIFAGNAMGLSYGVAMFLSACSVLGFGIVMPRPTIDGAVIKEEIAGLKMYMETAEKDRINFHNAPEKRPERFEKLLPYAMVLGVEKAWAEQFTDIYNTRPQWYQSNDPTFSPVLFASSMHAFSTASNASMFTSPSSAGSGGSGFSGGGSGGGFGGGGGGSW